MLQALPHQPKQQHTLLLHHGTAANSVTYAVQCHLYMLPAVQHFLAIFSSLLTVLDDCSSRTALPGRSPLTVCSYPAST